MAARLLALTALLLLPTTSFAGFFTYGYKHVTSPNADDYVVSTLNLRKYIETFWSPPILPITYWGPSANDVLGTVTMRFDMTESIESVHLTAGLASFNFGNGQVGESSLWGSRDGTNWGLLLNNPTPSRVDSYLTYDQEVPDSLAGGTSFWAQVRMEVHNAPTTSFTLAQFSRTNNYSIGNAFEIDITTMAAPEPTHQYIYSLIVVVTWWACLRCRRT